MADLRFWFDPVCPFAWLTSRWVRQVSAQRHYDVEWRFISLRLLNAHIDYATHFPPEYEAGHTSGLRLLRVAARARAEALGVECKVGIANRAVRVVILSAGIVFADLDLLAPAVYVLAGLGTITVLQRILHVRKELNRLAQPASDL